MVTTVKEILPSLHTYAQPQIWELVGPAGAGKSTLARALCQRSDSISVGPEIAFRKVEQIPSFIRSLPQVLPAFVFPAAGSRRWTWNEFKFLVYLRNWSRMLKQQADSRPGIILLDHGPIFKMATLHAFGPAWLRSPAADAWWSEFFQQWAALLNLIVWLDAPDSILAVRINERMQKHSIKDKTEPEVLRFLARYRSSYRFVLQGLADSHGPNVIQFDTNQETLNEIADGILAACGLAGEIDR